MLTRRLVDSINEILGKEQPFVLATVVEQTGSAPRAGGAEMVVRQGGTIAGTIGGGKVEAQVIEAARELFQTRKHRLASFDLTGASGADLDLICGGRMEILLEFVDSTPEEKRLQGDLQTAMHSKIPTFLVRCLSSGSLERALVREGTFVWQSPSFPEAPRAQLLEKCRRGRNPEILTFGEERFFVQPFRAPGRVCLFGAGHVALEVACLARHVGFEVAVLDDREEFANRERFPDADDVRVLSTFEGCVAPLNPDAETYLVILTRGHRHDRVVLEQALRSEAAYVGMIGSRSKWTQMKEDMVKSGFARADLEKVHTPIGLKIGSESPEEIAVSIVGELIAQRAGWKIENL